MPNILIVGAASGIGREFVRAYVKEHENNVIAIDRHFPQPSTSVESLLTAYRETLGCEVKGPLCLHEIDITKEGDISELSDFITRPLDLLIHSAGVRGLAPSVAITQSSDVTKAETINVIDAQTLKDTFDTNAVGSFLLLQGMLPKLRPSGHSRVIIMGSRMGSIGDNTNGGAYAYRASKAALNAIVKSFAVDVPDIIVAIVHPGRVESGLVSVKEDGAIGAEASVADMLSLIEGLGKEHSGKFFDRFGNMLPW